MNDNQRIVLSWLKEKRPDGITPFENIYNLINETWSLDIDADEKLYEAVVSITDKEIFQVLAAFAEWGLSQC